MLKVPYRSQLDGTPYASANCGPAILGMALDAFGIHVPTWDLRDIVNVLQNSYRFDDGTSWEALARIAIDYGLEVQDLYQGNHYRVWTPDRIEAHLLQGHPVIILARYKYLPGNGRSGYEGDHYIAITGLAKDRVIYNDSAFYRDDGYSLVMDLDVLVQTWSTSSPAMTAVALAPGRNGPVVPRLLDRVRQERPPQGLLATKIGAAAAVEKGEGRGIVESPNASSKGSDGKGTQNVEATALLRPAEPFAPAQVTLDVRGDQPRSPAPPDDSSLLPSDEWMYAGLDSQAWIEGGGGTPFPFKREMPVAIGVVLLLAQVMPDRIRRLL